MSKAKHPRVIYDRSSGKVIYDELIRILGAMTGAKWGYHRTFGVVSYIECACGGNNGHIRVAAGETRARKIDIYLQRLDVTSPEWEAAAAYELRCKLALLPQLKHMLATINAYQIDPKYIAEIEHIESHMDVIGRPINKYIDECLYEIKINIDC